MSVDESRREGHSVLLVEDSPGDARLVEEAFAEVDRDTALTVVRDGTSALEFLRRRNGTGLPSLVLLDLHLPGCEGDEVLETIKSDPGLRHVPVVVLSDSDDQSDIRHMYDLHANAYVTKPTDMDQYVALVEQLSRFWFSTARLSPGIHDG